MSLPEPDLKFTIIVTTHTTNYHIILKNKLLYLKIQVNITTENVLRCVLQLLIYFSMSVISKLNEANSDCDLG